MRIKKLQIAILCVFGLMAFISTLAILHLFSNSIREPNSFVKNRTILTKSDLFYDYQITRYPSKVEIIESEEDEVSSMIGISTESWIFDFGIVPRTEASVRKVLDLNYMKGDRLKVDLFVFGNISDMISFSKNNFYLEGDEEVSVFLNITKETKIGNYTGEVDIIIKKQTFG